MQSLHDYLHQAIATEQKWIAESETFIKQNAISVLNEFRETQIIASKGKIEAYENMLEKLHEYEQLGEALPF